ncbi:MAG: nitroreductase family protein [Endomicrobiales bacterium]
MKTLDQIINGRRSIRKYLDRPVEEEKLAAVLAAACAAPSACNAQPWRYVAVTDPALRQRLCEEGLGGVVPNTWAKSAPAVIVACSETSLFTHTLAERVQGVEYHLIDLGISLEHLVLKAAELDLGTCFIGWFKGKAIGRLLQLPSSWKVECLVTLGYPSEVPSPTPRKKPAETCFLNGLRTPFKFSEI